MLTNKIILSSDPLVLNKLLCDEFLKEIPCNADTAEDLNSIAKRIGEISNQMMYLCPILNELKCYTKVLKAKDQKEEANEMMMRRDVVDTIYDILKQQYQALSRMITIKQEINREINLCDKV